MRFGEGWLLHCGDAYFHHAEMQVDPSRPWALALFQRFAVVDDATRRRSQEKLRQLVQSHGDEVEVFCAHDLREYERARDRAAD